jgi:hypothetical protein
MGKMNPSQRYVLRLILGAEGPITENAVRLDDSGCLPYEHPDVINEMKYSHRDDVVEFVVIEGKRPPEIRERCACCKSGLG